MNKEQFKIRSCEPADYVALQAIHEQPGAVWGTLQLPFPSVEKWKQRATAPADNAHWLVACVDDRAVGCLSLSIVTHSPRRRHVGQLGIAIHDDWQGRGVGTALLQAAIDLADRWLNLKRLELTVYCDNLPAIKLYRRAGFEVEGTLRRYAFRDGGYADAHAMARLRS